MSKVLVDRELLEKHISEIDSWNASMAKIIGKQPDYRWASLETLRAIIAQPTEAEVDCGDPEHCEWVEDNWPCPTCAALSAGTAEVKELRALLSKSLPIVEAHAGASHMIEGFRPKRNKWDELVDGIHAALSAKGADKTKKEG